MSYNGSYRRGSNQDPNALLRVILVGSGLILLLVVGLVVLLITSRSPSSNIAPPANPAAFDPLAAIGRRPAPASETLDVALPPVVGSFTRSGISGNDLRIIYGSGVTANYSNSTARIQVRAAVYGSPIEARAEVATLAARAGGGVAANTAGDTAYLLSVNASSGMARLAWSRDVYVYDVQAPSRETLNIFMANFPY